MSKTEKELLEVALSWSRAGKRIAIASVVETWGSAPRAAGSLLIIDEDARMEGSVSGGCVEGAVVAEAIDAISIGTSRMLTYGGLMTQLLVSVWPVAARLRFLLSLSGQFCR